jgi:hypothetical protein
MDTDLDPIDNPYDWDIPIPDTTQEGAKDVQNNQR